MLTVFFTCFYKATKFSDEQNKESDLGGERWSLFGLNLIILRCKAVGDETFMILFLSIDMS